MKKTRTLTLRIPFRVVMQSWQEKTPTASGGISVKSVKSESIVFVKKWEFLEFSHKHPVTLRPDNYEYGFGTVLPGG